MAIIIMLVLGFIWYQLIAIFGLSIGLHRRFAHNQFQTSKTFEVISLFLSMLAFSRSPVGWIGAHRIHHKFSDTEKDPHSPTHKGFWNVLLNNWKVEKIDRGFVKDLSLALVRTELAKVNAHPCHGCWIFFFWIN